ncbi:MAG: discoidin domain-containing protein, partial [Clostridia bacterium]|nr:discoidin domain-containing protein [Clostridia bacterium]
NFDVDEFAVFFSALSEEDVVAVYTYAPEGYEGAVLEEAADLHQPLPEFTVDPQSVLDSADLYISFDDGITDAKGHAVRQEGEVETVDGISGKALKIDGDKGHIAIDDYKFGTDSFTVTAWINGESSTSDPCIFSNKDWDSSSNPGWLISQRDDNWRYAANASGYDKVDKTFSYALMPEDGFSLNGQWYHMALVVDRAAQTLQLYINGRPYFEPVAFGVDHTDASYDTEYPFVIGEDGPEKYTANADGVSLVAVFDEIAVFKKALSGEEIAALYSLNMQEEAAAPAVEEPAGPATLLSQSWDNIFVNGEMMVNGGAGAWLAENPIEGDVSELGARGWAYISTPITGFAYAIDGGDAVKSADYIVDRPDVKAAINEEAEGFEITVDVSGLGDGAHTIKFYAVSTNDELVDTTFDLAFTKGGAAAEEPAAESKGLATVEEAAAGKNIITGYEFVSGTNGNGGEGPENLWDGNTGTKFCTGEFPIESIAKLDGTYDITGFTMATANDNADWNGRSPSAWTISVSADGENWTELASGDDSFFEETNFTYYAGEGTAAGVSYVKFNAEGAPSGCFQVSEVTLFGDKAADVTEELATKEEAPQTFDFGIVAAVAALISVCGFAVSKKKH